MNLRRTLLLLSFLGLLPSAAHAMTKDPMSWVVVGLERADYVFDNVEPAGEYGKATGGPPRTVSQTSWALDLRGALWMPDNRTALGHTPCIDFDFKIGSLSQGKPFSYKYRDGEGGFVFGYKAGFPWALVQRPTLRMAAGFGFGIIYVIGIADPANAAYQGLDFDGFASFHTDWDVTEDLGLHATYEYAPFNVAYSKQHRVRATATWSWLAASVQYETSQLDDTHSYHQLGLMAGFQIKGI